MENITNPKIYESYVIAKEKISRLDGKKVMVSISGGADSDIMLDLITKINNDVHFVFFDTGLEYTATKEHLGFLEEKYNIHIEREKAKLPIPTSCRKYGQPFISKHASEMIYRLQRHNFQWEDESFETLLRKYPKCKSALQWWCNENESDKFNIRNNKFLKEFMIANPPTFRISNKCCEGAKKDVSKDYAKRNDIELSLIGIRKAEGGSRSSLTSCFAPKENSADEYRPLFWYLNADKKEYEEYFGVTHSRCYSEYGLDRTGCAGCPFGKDFEYELEIILKNEPKLYKAVCKIFKDSYEYTRAYRKFVKEKSEQLEYAECC